MDAPPAEQLRLLELQRIDSAIDRLEHRRANLPEDVRLRELETSLAAAAQLSAERDGSLATVSREQQRFEDEIEMVGRKAESEEARAASGKVASPKELTAIGEEVASLRRRRATLEDELLERMEARETLEAELAELTSRREAYEAEQAEATKARDAAVADIDQQLRVERSARAAVLPDIGAELLELYEHIRSRNAGVGAAALVGDTCQACRVAISPVELAGLRKLDPAEVKRCENCRRILVMA